MNAQRRTRIAHSLTLTLGILLLCSLAGCNASLRQQGINALDHNNVDEADKNFSEAYKRDPTDWKSQYYLGLVRLRQGEPLKAQFALERALTLRHDDKYDTPPILDALAESIYQQNQTAALGEMLQKAADDYGTVPDYLRQAKYLGKTGDVDGAKLAFRKALKFAAKDDPQPYLAMADFFESVGDRQDTLTALGKAYYISPRNKTLADRFRKYGIVPGPTIMIEPKEDEPELIGAMDDANGRTLPPSLANPAK